MKKAMVIGSLEPWS